MHNEYLFKLSNGEDLIVIATSSGARQIYQALKKDNPTIRVYLNNTLIDNSVFEEKEPNPLLVKAQAKEISLLKAELTNALFILDNHRAQVATLQALLETYRKEEGKKHE